MQCVIKQFLWSQTKDVCYCFDLLHPCVSSKPGQSCPKAESTQTTPYYPQLTFLLQSQELGCSPPPQSWDPRSSTCFPCSIARDARPAQYEEGRCGCSERRRKDCKAFGLESQRWVFQVCHFIHSIWTLTGGAIGNSGGVCSGLEDTSYESLCRQGEWLGVPWTPEHPRMLISLLENDTVWRTHSCPTSHVPVDQWKVKE